MENKKDVVLLTGAGQIERLCPNSKVENGMNIVFESYSDKLVTSTEQIDNWINSL